MGTQGSAFNPFKPKSVIMEITFQQFVWMAATLLTGLTAGLCFTWSNAVTPGIGQLDDLSFLRAFQSMNRSILNPVFFIVFLGPTLLHLGNVYLHRNSGNHFWLFVVAAILFIVGVVLVTVLKNVPLNEVLDKANLITLSEGELRQLRQQFETPWNRWHLVRTLSSFLSFGLLVLQLLLPQKLS